MMRAIRKRMGREDGMTIPELITGVTISLVVFMALYTFIDVASSNSERTVARIEANKSARPVMAEIMDKLHSTCVAPGLAPILAGSTADSMSFVHQTGSTVTPTPVKRTIAFEQLSGLPAGQGRLTETTYDVASGTAPTWVFSTTPATPGTRVMLGESRAPVKRATIGASSNIPFFQYYAFGTTGTISTTPLATPLSAANAAKVVQVKVSFAMSARDTDPADKPSVEDSGEISLTDTAILRFTPPSESSSSANLPCA